MLQFEKPIYKITDSIENNFYGKFELEPLERGFGTTLGNALRRVMLSSLLEVQSRVLKSKEFYMNSKQSKEFMKTLLLSF